jgi:AraC-like DNA-binding protein
VRRSPRGEWRAREVVEDDVLTRRRLAEGPGFALYDVRCACGRSAWCAPEETRGYGVVLVRSGCFRRRTDGKEALLDPAAAYFERPGEEQQVAHPHDGGDSCTGIALGPDLVAELLGGDPTPPSGPVFTTPRTDLAHRRLLACVSRGDDGFETAEQAIALVAAILETADERRVSSGRPATAEQRRRTVDGVREALYAEPRLGLVELGRAVATSPHHLSRVFAAETGETVSRYRNRLRVRLALERIAEGEPCLARLAAELGFADHAHLTNVVRREAGAPPSRLRALVGRS